MNAITYGTAADTTPHELAEFYERMGHEIAAHTNQLQHMMSHSAVFVVAREGKRLVGIARGVCDGLRGYLTECKLDPAFQGPGAVTRTDGRVEHDEQGIAGEMARRVMDTLFDAGARRIDVLAWGTEVDFLEELGFRRRGGLVGLTCGVEDRLTVATHAAR